MTTRLRQSPSARMEEDGGEGPPRDRPRYGPHQDTILPTASGKRGPHHQSLLQSPASPASPYLSRNTHLPTVLELPLSSGFLSPPAQVPSVSPSPGRCPLSSLSLASTRSALRPTFHVRCMSVSSPVPLPGLPAVFRGTGDVTGPPQCMDLLTRRQWRWGRGSGLSGAGWQTQTGRTQVTSGSEVGLMVTMTDWGGDAPPR